jgi:hypothetical protein
MDYNFAQRIRNFENAKYFSAGMGAWIEIWDKAS